VFAPDKIVAQHSVHLRDNLSWTRAGVAWHPNEWGYDVALWLAYRTDGLEGLQILLAATIVLLGAVVLLAVQAFQGSARDAYWVGASISAGRAEVGWERASSATLARYSTSSATPRVSQDC
jgi:hypothetical protein